MKVLLAALNAKFVQSSLALRYLQLACKERGLTNTETAEYTINHNLYDIVGRIYAHRADAVGLSCYVWNIEMTLKTARLIHEVLPSCKIFLGGPEVSYTAEEVLKEHDYIDCIVQGEGEEVLPQLIQAWEQGIERPELTGVLFRNGNALEGSKQLCEVADLNTLPFPYEGEDFSKLSHKIIYYESSRGCPFQCQYCLSGMSQSVRFRNTRTVISELKRFIAAGVKQVKFVDRTFNCNPEHYRTLLRFFVSVSEDINFHLEIEPGLLTDEDLEILKAAPPGRIQMEMGIQSTYERTLDAVRRVNDWPRIEKVMKTLRDYQSVHLHLDLIVGLPYETMEHLQQSFNEIYALKPHVLQIGFLKLLKGSGIRNRFAEDYRFDPDGPYEILETAWLSFGQVRRMKRFEDVFERVYNSNKFTDFLNYVVPFYESPFVFYDEVTLFIDKVHGDEGLLSDRTLIDLLYKFVRDAKKIGERGKETAVELLDFNVRISFAFRLQPGFFQKACHRNEWDGVFRNEPLMKTYYDDYRFTNMRDIKRRYQLWPLSPEAAQVITGKPFDGAVRVIARQEKKGVSRHVINKP